MLDRVIIEVDKIVKTLCIPAISKRPHPDSAVAEGVLSVAQVKHVIGLMRVNHCGEICAQALYQGQALTARDKTQQQSLQLAAFDEVEHLAWTRRRVHELGGRTSMLCPFFYFGSLTIGITAGIFGDKWSLGFLAQTEEQVGKHLAGHLAQLPEEDNKTWAILQQMREDEARHEKMAYDYGAANLPPVIKKIMAISSKIMTTATYYI